MMTPQDTLSGTSLGRYLLGGLIGRGGMGEVYQAEDTMLRRPVAIKVLPESFTSDSDRLARFVQEARTASALNHPHLVSIYEIGEAAVAGANHPVHFIAMELVQGETLRQLLDTRRLDLRRGLEYLAQAADALAAAHAAGIVHRDLKPENLMIAQEGYAKVLDFGLAKLRALPALTDAAANDLTMTSGPAAAPGTSPGMVMGTVGYMSPEQAQGQPVDHRTDIFSFGCILYETGTGARPFAGTSAVDTLHRIIHMQPQPLAQLAPATPSELQRIVRKCLAKPPEERYQSMKDLALDLRDLRRELDSGSNASVARSAAVPRVGAGRFWIGAIVLLCAVAAAAAYWLLGSSKEVALGEPKVGIERITESGLVIDAVISPDGKYIAYVESRGGVQKLMLRQARGGRPLELVTPVGGFWGIAFSPDATSIYYSIKNSKETLGTLYAIPALGGSTRAVLSGIDSNVTFSPDGKRIAYLRVEADGSGVSSLMVAGADGENPQPLVTKRPPQFLAPAFFAGPSWSPDGARISAAVRNSQTSDARLVVFDVAGGAEQVFPRQFAEATFTQWLPDGSGIILTGRDPGMFSTGNGGQLWIQPYPSGEIRRITNDLLEYRTASVTADGNSLLSVAYEASSRLSLMPLAGGEEQRLPEDRSAGASGLAWSHDGRSFFYLTVVRGELQLWTMGADGSNPREVVANVRPSGVAATPDGRWIVYAAERDGAGGIWRANVDGSNPRLLVPVPGGPVWLSLQPDGSAVYFTSRRDGSPATYRVSIEGGEAVLVTRLLERAVPSPDGRLLLGIYKEHPKAPLALGLIDPATGQALRVLPDFPSGGGSGGLAWMPGGQTLLYTTSERTNLWTQPATGGTPRKFTNFTDLWVVRFALSPDGKTLLLCRGNIMRDALLLTNFR
jgi:eukaryotic-like serine/threonine-protein kinase